MATTAAPAPSRNPFAVLAQHPDYRTFWTGQTLSLVGTWMQTMAIGWLSLELSGSAFIVGLVASAGAVPIVLLSMHAGALVDRSDRLRLVRRTQSVLLVQAVVLWAVTLAGYMTVPLLLALAVVQGVCSAIEIPARQSLIIQLVGRDDLQAAIALNSSGFNLARIVGPALGGLVIHQAGIAWCFGLNASSFVAVLWGLFRIGTRDAPATARFTSLGAALRESTASARDGLRYLNQPGAARDLLSIVVVGAIFGGPFIALLPVMARDQLRLGAGGYGGLLASLGIGGLLGALAVAGPAGRWHRGRTLTTSSLAFPLLLLAVAWVTDARLANAVLLLTGTAMIMFNALSNGTLQLLVAESYRGRLMAFYSLVFVGLSQAVGALAMGAVARAVGVAWAVTGCAVVTLGFSGWMAWRSAVRHIGGTASAARFGRVASGEGPA
jgi:MFS family permease